MHRIALLTFLAGCSTKPAHDIMLVDASIDTPPPQIDAPLGGPTIVDLQLFGTTTPDLITYRDGTGGWLVPDSLGNGRYQLHVTNAYEVVAVCSFTGVAASYDAEELAATVDDGKQYLFCGGGGGSTTTVAVTGTMNQAGTVAMGDTASSTSAPWNFTLHVSPGPHDLSAIGNHRMLLERGISITAATALPTVDVVNDGLAMGSATLALTGTAAGETITSTLDLFTTNELVTVSETTDGTVALPPESLLDAQDFKYLQIDSSNAAQTIDRGVFVFDYDGSANAFTLPSALSGITYATSNEVLSATWGQLPTYTAVDLFVFTGSTTFGQQHVMATKGWIDATGATSLAFDSSAPDYAAGWKPDLAAPYMRMFAIDDQEVAAEYRSSIVETVHGATAHRAPSRTLPHAVQRRLLGRR
jgi:hypothetical protein